MSIGNENINTSEKRNKVNTIKWRPIYEDIDEAYFIGSKLSQMILCKNVRIVQIKLDLSH